MEIFAWKSISWVGKIKKNVTSSKRRPSNVLCFGEENRFFLSTQFNTLDNTSITHSTLKKDNFSQAIVWVQLHLLEYVQTIFQIKSKRKFECACNVT